MLGLARRRVGARGQRPLDAVEVAPVGGGVERARARLQGHDAAHFEGAVYGGLVPSHGFRADAFFKCSLSLALAPRDCGRRRCAGAFCVATAPANSRSLKCAVIRQRVDFPSELARGFDVNSAKALSRAVCSAVVDAVSCKTGV